MSAPESDMADERLSTRDRYSRGAMLLHWLTAAAFAVQLGLGFRMHAPRGPQTFAVFQLHKSVGISILLLTLLRIGWRLAHPAPTFHAGLTLLERRLATVIHRGFYAVLLIMPLTGWLMVSSSSTRIPTILFGVVPWPHLPVPIGSSDGIGRAASLGHLVLAWLAMLMIALHIAGALKHQFVDRDDELGRMVPAGRKLLGGLALVLVAGFVAMVAFGRTVALHPIALNGAAADTRAAARPMASPAPPPRTIPDPVPVASAPAAPIAPVAAEGAKKDDVAAATPWVLRKGAALRFHSSWSQGAIDGGFSAWTAAIVFDPAALDTSVVDVSVDLASVTTGDADQQGALPGDDWFAAKAHPKAAFHATRFRHLSGDRYQANGTLTLRGVARPQSLLFTLRIAGDVATMTGTASIDRTTFGVGQGEWASTADVPANVALTISLRADRKIATK